MPHYKKTQALAVLMLLILLNTIFTGEAVPTPAGADDEPEDYQHICADHPPVSNTKTSNSSKWNLEGKTKERHIHIGNKIARQKIASIIHGRDVDDGKEDYSKLCAGVLIEYKEGHAEATVFGYGSEKAELLAVVHPETKGAIQMKFVNKASKYTSEVTTFNHYVDNVIATTWCFPDGKVGWNIWSTQDVFKPDEKKMALDYIQKIGFDPKDAVPFYESSCPNKFNKA